LPDKMALNAEHTFRGSPWSQESLEQQQGDSRRKECHSRGTRCCGKVAGVLERKGRFHKGRKRLL
jgi:hypothetical protein